MLGRRQLPCGIGLLLALGAVGCTSRSDTDSPGEKVAATRQPLNGVGQVCLAIQRGSFGDVADAQIHAVNVNANAGTAISMGAGRGGSGMRQSLLRFDLAAVPSHAVVTSASVTLTALPTGAGGPPINAHRVTAGWVEDSVRWNPFAAQAGGYYAAPVEAVFPSTATSTAGLPLTLVQGWVDAPATNFGLLLEADAASSITVFTSSEGPILSAHPRLDLCYTVTQSCAGQPDGTPCDDGNGCTTADTCQSGRCQPGPAAVCATDSCHVAGTCNPSTGKCSAPVNKPNNTPCDDHNQCSSNDTCQSGQCVPGPLLTTCPPPDACHQQGTCKPTEPGNCSYVPIPCPPPDQCHAVGVCDPSSGACSYAPKADGTACDDGDATTVNDVCTAGVCAGASRCAGVTCAAQDQCHAAGACDPTTGACSNPAKPDGVACDDGDAATASDVCTAGVCAGVSRCAGVTCPPAADACHLAGVCNPATGACDSPVAPDGTACPGVAPTGFARHFGDVADPTSSAQISDLVATASGDVIVAGGFTGSLDLGGGPMSANGGAYMTLARFDAAGNHVWSKSFGTPGNYNYPNRIVGDAAGNVYMMGVLYGAVDFGGGLLLEAGGTGAGDAFVAKFDGAGNHLWSKVFGDGEFQGIWGGAVDAAGDLVVTGTLQGSADFGGGPLASAGQADLFVAKIGADGHHVWSKRYGTALYEEGADVAVDAAGNIFLSGYLEGSVDFGHGLVITSPQQYGDGFLARLDPAGNPLWARGPFLEAGWPLLAVDAAGDAFVSVALGNVAADFGGGPVGAGLVLAKISASGQHVFSAAAGGSQLWSNRVAVDGAGRAVVVGGTWGPADFGTGPIGASDAFMVRYDAAGAVIATRALGSSSWPQLSGLSASGGGLYLGGSFPGTVDLGSGLLVADANTDALLARIDTTDMRCSQFACQAGACVLGAKAEGAPCDDGSACTSGDACHGGACAGATVTCAADQCHAASACDPVTGCANAAVADGTPCEDGDACTVGDSCQAGTCVAGAAVTCVAPDSCHGAGTCDPTTGACSFPVFADGTGCDDGDPCTFGDTCQRGRCASTPLCPGVDQCNRAACDPAAGTCSPALPVADGTPCDDGDACTRLDTCQAGVCVGASPVACVAADACHAAGTCDPTTGACSSPALPDGAGCDDGDACTQGDACQAGACHGSPATCTPADTCHVGSCDPAAGCLYTTLPDGTACVARGLDGTCEGGTCLTACENGIQDGGETGPDCGGPCAPCEVCLSTPAGSGTAGFADGRGAVAGFSQPGYMALDAQGNLYVADRGNHAIRKVTPAGVVTTVAGTGASGYQDGPAATAQFSTPSSVAVDAQGNLFVADTSNWVIRKIDTNGNVSTVPGTSFQGPVDLRFDAQGNLWVIDGYSGEYQGGTWGEYYIFPSTLWRIGTDGVATQLVGSYAGIEWSAPAMEALAIDAQGNVYVTGRGTDDGSSTHVWKLDPQGYVQSFAGWDGIQGGRDGLAADNHWNSASFNQPHGITVDGQGNVYVVDNAGDGGTIRKITPDGQVTTVFGKLGASQHLDGCAAHLPLFQPWGVVAAPDGTLFVSDKSGMIRRIGLGPCDCAAPTCWDDLQNQDETSVDCDGVCGSWSCPSCGDGLQNQGETSVDCGGPCDPCSCSDGVQNQGETGVDCGGPCPLSCNCTDGIQSFGETGVDCGGVCPPCSGPASCGNHVKDAGEDGVDCGGPCAPCPSGPIDPGTPDVGSLCLSTVVSHLGADPNAYDRIDGLAALPDGNLVVALGDGLVMVTPSGVVTPFAGDPMGYGYQDGPAATAQFGYPLSPVADRDGNVYVMDHNNYAIRKIGVDGVVSTIAGGSFQSGYVDGPARDAKFVYPQAIALDAVGNIYVADGYMVRKVGTDGVVSTVAGLPDWQGHADGPADRAMLGWITGIVADPAGNVYVTDAQQDQTFAVRKIGADGVVSTLAYVNGGNLSIDAAGNLYTWAYDWGWHSLWQIRPDGSTVELTATAQTDSGPICAAEMVRPFWGGGHVAVAPDGSIYIAGLDTPYAGVIRLGTGSCTCCHDGKRDFGEPSVDCGGPCAAKCGTGSSCNVGSDCQSLVCAGGVCQAPRCDDGVKNGTESDVDCGGASCPACPTGGSCQASSDCQSLVCGTNVCWAPTCSDHVRNQGETGIDCGGPCPACATCSDGIKNQGETGIDCGGPCPACVTGCAACTSSQVCVNLSGTNSCLPKCTSASQCSTGCCAPLQSGGSACVPSTYCSGGSSSSSSGSTSSSSGSSGSSSSSSSSSGGTSSSSSGGVTGNFSFVSYENCQTSRMMIGCGGGMSAGFCEFMSTNVQGRFYDPTITVPGGPTNGHYASQLVSYTGDATIDAELRTLNAYGMQGVGGAVGGVYYACLSLPTLAQHMTCHSIGDQSGVPFVPTIVCTYTP